MAGSCLNKINLSPLDLKPKTLKQLTFDFTPQHFPNRLQFVQSLKNKTKIKLNKTFKRHSKVKQPQKL